MYDKNVPLNLLNLQKWFADVITTPLIDNKMQGSSNAHEMIKPSKQLSASQRIEIYNQQYWWRLLETMHKNFPLLTRLFGYSAFNEELAVPYLYEHKSQHFSLAYLGENLSDWIQNTYNKEDKKLVYHAAEVDIGYQQLAFRSENSQYFELPFDLFSFRKQMLKQSVEFWEDNDFPPLKKGSYKFKLIRNERHQIIAINES